MDQNNFHLELIDDYLGGINLTDSAYILLTEI